MILEEENNEHLIVEEIILFLEKGIGYFQFIFLKKIKIFETDWSPIKTNIN
jgi:hypothetical protein